MKTLPISEVKMKLSALIKGLSLNSEEIYITRNGRAIAVLMSTVEVDRLKETKKIINDKELMKEIKKGLQSFKDKKVKRYTFSELYDEF